MLDAPFTKAAARIMLGPSPHYSIFDMLDATERKTLAWCMFATGVLCLIPGEIPKGPAPMDYARQVVGRLLDHHATHGAWAICVLMVAYHLRQLRKEPAELPA